MFPHYTDRRYILLDSENGKKEDQKNLRSTDKVNETTSSISEYPKYSMHGIKFR